MVLLSDTIIELLNFRAQQEEISSRMYKAMSIWLDYSGYTGAAKLFDKYAKEEQEHVSWATDYLLNLDIKPKMFELPKPECEFESLSEVLNKAFKHELEVTNQCKEFASACASENDYMTLVLAQKYLTEQVDEIAKTTLLLDKLEAFGDSKVALKLLDTEMGQM